MELIDVLKVVVLLYILFVFWVDTKYIEFLSNPLIKNLWIFTIIAVFLFTDIVLGIILAIAFILTLLKLETMEVSNISHYASLPHIEQPEFERVQQNDDETGQDTAHQALEKYVVDDYLQKAASDGVIPENYNKFPNPLGKQYNIQGVEKDIVGYNVDAIGYN